MSERIQQLAKQADLTEIIDDAYLERDDWQPFVEKFAELLMSNLADELHRVAKGSKKFNPEWANGVDHAAMLAQRMLMNLPEEE